MGYSPEEGHKGSDMTEHTPTCLHVRLRLYGAAHAAVLNLSPNSWKTSLVGTSEPCEEGGEGFLEEVSSNLRLTWSSEGLHLLLPFKYPLEVEGSRTHYRLHQ